MGKGGIEAEFLVWVEVMVIDELRHVLLLTD